MDIADGVGSSGIDKLLIRRFGGGLRSKLRTRALSRQSSAARVFICDKLERQNWEMKHKSTSWIDLATSTSLSCWVCVTIQRSLPFNVWKLTEDFSIIYKLRCHNIQQQSSIIPLNRIASINFHHNVVSRIMLLYETYFKTLNPKQTIYQN